MLREQFWFFYPLRVRYSEVDCQGVVFNAYLMYFDTTITEPMINRPGVDFHDVYIAH
jgi:acyl-CoA thioesterase FadM